MFRSSRLLCLPAILLMTACSSPGATKAGARTPIGTAWEIEGDAEQPARRLFALAGGTSRMLDDRVVAYHAWSTCLVYESARDTGTVVLAASYEGRAPVVVAKSDPERPWDFDEDAMRRYHRTFDVAGSRIVIETIHQFPLCGAASEQPMFDGHVPVGTVESANLIPPKEQFVGVHAVNSSGHTTLHDAAREGRPGLVDALLQAGIAVDARNRTDTTPLMVAIMYNKPAAVARLLHAGADVNARSGYKGFTPLIFAARHQGVESARLLLKAGADASLRDDEGRSAADWARAPQHHNPGVLALLGESRSGRSSSP